MISAVRLALAAATALGARTAQVAGVVLLAGPVVLARSQGVDAPTRRVRAARGHDPG